MCDDRTLCPCTHTPFPKGRWTPQYPLVPKGGSSSKCGINGGHGKAGCMAQVSRFGIREARVNQPTVEANWAGVVCLQLLVKGHLGDAHAMYVTKALETDLKSVFTTTVSNPLESLKLLSRGGIDGVSVLFVEHTDSSMADVD